jgi:hypothetical protein
MKRFLIPSVIAVVFISLMQIRATGAPDAATDTPDRAALEKQFAQKLSHSRMLGFYSIIGQEGPPKPDEYTLGAVTKGDGDKWVFNSSLQFGKQVINVPLEIPVLWAGDTPVISVTDFTIPGMGSYTARVMIHGDHYAGVWSSAKHGGYMWGRLEQVPTTQPVGEKDVK